MTENVKKWNSLIPRVLTAVFGGALVVFLLIFSNWTAYGLLSVISLGCLWEFYQICKKTNSIPNILIGVIGSLLSLISIFAKIELTHIIISFLFILASVELIKNNTAIINTISSTLTGLIYCIVPFILFFRASGINDNYDWKIIIVLFIMIWSFDSGAYFAGKLIGKHKMIPKVSPGKTWEGTIGGVLFCFLGIYVFNIYHPIFSIYKIFILTVLVSLSGIFGDLFVSQMKRNINLKDTGSILPGHGGFLDRFDGFLMACTFYSISIILF